MITFLIFNHFTLDFQYNDRGIFNFYDKRYPYRFSNICYEIYIFANKYTYAYRQNNVFFKYL